MKPAVTTLVSFAAMCGMYPPPAYDYPYRGGKLKVIESTPAVQQYCGPNAQACAWGGKFHGMRECTLFLQNGFAPRSYRHEQAHCNGWTIDHPGGVTGC